MENSEIRKAIAEIKKYLASISSSFKLSVQRGKWVIVWEIDYHNPTSYKNMDSIASAEIAYRGEYFKLYLTPMIINSIEKFDKEGTIVSNDAVEAYDGIIVNSKLNYNYISKNISK